MLRESDPIFFFPSPPPPPPYPGCCLPVVSSVQDWTDDGKERSLNDANECSRRFISPGLLSRTDPTMLSVSTVVLTNPRSAALVTAFLIGFLFFAAGQWPDNGGNDENILSVSMPFPPNSSCCNIGTGTLIGSHGNIPPIFPKESTRTCCRFLCNSRPIADQPPWSHPFWLVP